MASHNYSWSVNTTIELGLVMQAQRLATAGCIVVTTGIFTNKIPGAAVATWVTAITLDLQHG
ncbi:unnamed protein product [Clonostachys solani]|uniref:Uncharacterized protein n=1 Tax=Clonostachys solani TaxID=160281 RepID=A0A9N9Z9J6_9HYPO|nr:unnamed protein product [Clonostachys solani]